MFLSQRFDPSAVVVTTKSRRTDIAVLSFSVLAMLFVLLQSSLAFAKGAPESFADLVEEVSPAVVNITTTTKVAERVGPRGVVPEGSPFEEFFREFQDRSGPNNPRRPTSALGSGFVISEDGFVITNNHVIEGADEILVEFFDGSERAARVVGTDRNVDIAVLKVEADKPLDFVQFGDSDVMRVGDWVMAVGNPLGQGFSVSAGIVSARNRSLSGNYDDYIQTDAAINRGNSGGPLFNMDGRVIGVNTAILSPNGGSIGLGFSMSSNVVGPVVDQLIEFGEVRRGWLGVNINSVSDEMAQALGMDDATGAIVVEVFDGPAKAGGVMASDVILKFDGKDVSSSGELVRIVGATSVGKTVKVVVLRDGARKTLEVTLGQRPGEETLAQAAPETAPQETSVEGMTLSELTSELRDELGLDPATTGVVITGVDDASDAAAKGLQAGDLITDAAQRDVTSVKDFQAVVTQTRDAGRSSLLLLVRRDGQPRFVVLELN